VEQRGLAGAVRSDDGVDLALPDRERDVSHGHQTAEVLAQALSPQQFARAPHLDFLANRPGAPLRTSPTMPPRENNASATTTTPTTSFQCSVSSEAWSVSTISAKAPSTG